MRLLHLQPAVLGTFYRSRAIERQLPLVRAIERQLPLVGAVEDKAASMASRRVPGRSSADPATRPLRCLHLVDAVLVVRRRAPPEKGSAADFRVGSSDRVGELPVATSGSNGKTSTLGHGAVICECGPADEWSSGAPRAGNGDEW